MEFAIDKFEEREKMKKNNYKKLIKIFKQVIFIIFSIFMIMYSLKYYYYNMIYLPNVCTEELDVKCIDIKETIDEDDILFQSSIWKGTYKDEQLTFESNRYISKTYKIGQQEKIKLNPHNFKEYIDSTATIELDTDNRLIIFIIIWIIFLFINIFDDIKHVLKIFKNK